MYIVVEVIDTKNKESEESKWCNFNHYGLFNVTVSTMNTIKFFDKLEDAQEYAKFGGNSKTVKKLDYREDCYQQVAETIKNTITTTRTVVDIKNGDKICFVGGICSKYEEGV